MRFIDQHAARRTAGRRWGVASICAQLVELGAAIAPSTYYAARAAGPTAARLRDEALSKEIVRVHAENYGVYGARKVWAQLNREAIPVARCTVERLMRAQGLVGARRGRRIRTTIAGPQARAADLVRRRFNPPAPDQLWVADFTYVPTWSGMVYVAFVIGRLLTADPGLARRDQHAGRTRSRCPRASRLGTLPAGTRRPVRADCTLRRRVAIYVHCLHRTPGHSWCRPVGRVGRRCLRQRAGRVHYRTVQDRAHQTERPVAHGGTGRDRHPRIRRLVQPPTTPQRRRRPPTRRTRGAHYRQHVGQPETEHSSR